jgi:preprotein translocase subunit SecD
MAAERRHTAALSRKETQGRMNIKLKKLFTNVRVVILLVALLLAVVAIHPNPDAQGVTIRNVVKNSSASLAGIQNPEPTEPPLSKERVIAINSIPINTVADYFEATENLRPSQVLTVITTDNSYSLTVKAKTRTIVLDELVNTTVEESYQVNRSVNGSYQLVNKTRNKTVEVPKTETEYLGVEDIGLRVAEAPSTNIRKGLDLQGGTRVLLQPDGELSKDDAELLLANMKQRLNVFGLSDIVIRQSSDLSGNQFIVVEIAGANEEEVKNLLAEQGKFEAKIGNNTVFRGGERDITYVCRSADCSGIDPQQGCAPIENGYTCRFRFSIALDPGAAEEQARVTEQLSVITHSDAGELLSRDNQYLNETLDLFLDDQQVDTLNIGADLKGRAVTDIAISGSGVGVSEQEAMFDALANRKRLQTIMITGSLPVKLTIVKTDTLSPILGEEFVKNSLLLGFAAIVAVSVILFLRYRKIQLSGAILFVMIAEIVLLMGVAALIGWNIDLAAIAGIIIALGTGVDHAIVISDELLRGETEYYSNWKKRIKNAFFIIMAAYFTTVVAMFPLYRAGAGLLKGFAIITILGLSFGVFITRPAFAAIIEVLLKE